MPCVLHKTTIFAACILKLTQGSTIILPRAESSWLADYTGATLVAGRENDVQMC